MAIATKVRRIGNSLGIVLPKEALQALHVEEGATVYLTEAPKSSLVLSAGQKDFGDKAVIVEDLINRYRNALAELAK